MGKVLFFLIQVLCLIVVNDNLLLLKCSADILSNYDFDTLKNAVTDAFANDVNMGHVMMARMVSFQERIRKERSSDAFVQQQQQQLSLREEEEEGDYYDENDKVLFEPPSDYYSFDGIHLDFGDTDRVALDNIIQTSVYHTGNHIVDMNTIRLDNGRFEFCATTNTITIWFYSSIKESDSKEYRYYIEGIYKLEPIVLKQPVQSNNGHERQIVVVFVLAATNDDRSKQTISWYSGNEYENTLYCDGSLELSEEGTDLRVFHIPVADMHMLASLQTTKIQTYIVSFNDNGHLNVKPCAIIPIVRVKDFESFTINGQLYVGITNGLGSTDVATDIQYFRIRYEHFLGVVNVGGAVIYQWKGAIFVRIQTFHLPSKAIKWHSIVDDDEALLMLILNDQLLFFAWNKQLRQFVSSGHWQDEQFTFGEEVTATSYSGNGDGHHILHVSIDSTFIQFDVHLKRQRVATETKANLFYDEAHEIKNELDRQERFLNEASSLLKSLESKLMEVLDAPRITNSGPQLKPCNDLSARLNNVEESLNLTKTSMTNFLQKDLSDKVHLRGKRTFRSVKVLETAEVRGNLKVDSLNGLNMSHFFADSVMSKTASYVTGLKTFTGRVVIIDGVTVTKSLDGQNPDDFIRLNKPQQIYDMMFLAPVTVEKNVEVAGLVNGIDLSEEAVCLNRDKPQTITGDKIFVDDMIVEDEVLVSGKINGVKLSKLSTETVTSSGMQQITGKKLFAQMTVKGDLKAHRVNGLDLPVLDSRIVRVDRPTVIVAPKTFAETVSIADEGELRTETVNGLTFPEDFVYVSEEHVVLSASKDFTRSVTVSGDVTVNGNLDGIDLNDVMRTTGDQELCGNKNFVGPVHITRMERDMPDISSKSFIDTVVVHGNLHVAHSINNVPFNDIILRNETNLVLSGPITFLEPQSLNGQVHINGLINGLNLEMDFLHPRENQIITGTKIFRKSVTIKGHLEIGRKLDGVNLQKLMRNVVSLSSRNAQFVSGKKSFVDGISIEDTLILSSLHSKTLFPKRLHLKNLIVKGNVLVDGYVNDVNLQELHANRMTLTTDQDILVPVRISGTVQMNNLEIFGHLNGQNTTRLWNDVLFKNKAKLKKVFTGQKRFTGRFDAPRLFTKQGLNGLSIRDVKERTVPIVNGKILSGSRYAFDGGIVVDGALETHGTINGVDLTKTVMDSVRKHSDAYPVIGAKVFEELHVKGNVWVDGTVNDLRLDRDVLTATTPQNITGQYILLKDARLTDSVEISLLKAKTLKVTGDLEIASLTTGGNVNGVNPQHLQRDAILQNQRSHQTIDGEKTIHGAVHFHKDLSVKHGVNGYNYAEHFKDIVLVNSSTQVITGKKQFLGDVEAKVTIQCKGPVSVPGRLNDVNADEVLARSQQPHVIHKHVAIHGSLTISGDVKTHETLNGFNISKDVLINPDQVVTAPKIVKTMTVDGNINAKNVNGYNLEILRHDTLTTDSNERVTGRKIVKGIVTIHPSKSQSTTLDKDLEPSVPSTKQKLHFHGNMTFLRGVSKGKLVTKPQFCTSFSSCKTLAAINRATTQKASSFLSMNLVQTVNVPDISAVEVIKTSSKVLFVTGFSSCDKPMKIHVWNSVQKKFFLGGKSNVFSVFKMKTFYGTDQEPLLCILHRNCRTGQNATSIYSTRGERLILKSTTKTLENVVDFDVTLPNGNKNDLLMATLQDSSRIVLERFVGSARKLLSTIEVPVIGDRIRWLSLSHGDSLLFISAKRIHQTVIYQASSTGSLQHLYTLQAYIHLSWTLHGNVGFLVATKGSKDICETMVYKMEVNLSGVSIVEVEHLETEMKDTPTTVEAIFDTTLQLCAVNYHNKINVYTKGLSGNYLRRSSMILEDIDRAIPVIANGKLLLITAGDGGWNAFLSDLYRNNQEPEFNCLDG